MIFSFLVKPDLGIVKELWHAIKSGVQFNLKEISDRLSNGNKKERYSSKEIKNIVFRRTFSLRK